MAISAEEIKNEYPLPAYNYRVSIGVDTLAFSEVNGLSIEYEPVTYRHGLSFFEGDVHLPGKRQPVNVRLSRGIKLGGDYLFSWINSIRLTSVEKEDVTIDLCDEGGNPVISWVIRNAFPTKLDAPGFDANTNEVAIETLELRGSEITITYH